MNIVTEIAGAITILAQLYVRLQSIYGGKPLDQVIADARADNKAVEDKP